MSLRTVVVAALFGTMCVVAEARAQTLQGVWKVAEVQVTGGSNPGTSTNVQPGFYIFTKGHYSIITVNGDKPRAASPAAKDPAKLTDAEKLARYEEWNPFTANAGTYTVKGNTLTTKPLVAKNQGVMDGTFQGGGTREFKIEGTTLWLIQKGGGGGPQNGEIRTKLVRVE